jgi:2-polyprenyl-3-methyl-5-hydroxy-6-metoxy-1,4-benzoquinol methylase
MKGFELRRGPVVDRVDEICRVAAGKRVLHVGCADAPYSVEQHQQGRLLHSRIADAAKTVTGVDFDQAGIDFLASLGFKDLYCLSVEDLGPLREADKFDLIIAGEIIEHLPNPARSLAELRAVLRPDGQLLVTVPNSLSIKTALRALLGREWVHPDHLYYFSPATLTKLLETSGFITTKMKYYGVRPTSRIARLAHDIIYALLRRLAPWLADGLIVEAKPNVD